LEDQPSSTIRVFPTEWTRTPAQRAIGVRGIGDLAQQRDHAQFI
jgi:hypothetical protein